MVALVPLEYIYFFFSCDWWEGSVKAGVIHGVGREMMSSGAVECGNGSEWDLAIPWCEWWSWKGSALPAVIEEKEMPSHVKNACPRMVDHGCLKQSVRQSGPRVLLWKTLSQTPRHKIWRSSLSETICGVEIVWTSFETYASVYIAFHQFESLFLPWDMLNEKERLQASQRSGP